MAKKNYKECVVIASQHDRFSVDFDGYGITINTENTFRSGDKAIVEYSGVIGKPNFKCGYTPKVTIVKEVEEVFDEQLL